MRPRLCGAWGLVLLLVPVLATAEPARPLTVDDVLRLHMAGVSEEIILSEIIVTGSRFSLDVEDILRLNEAGISERLLQFLVDTGREGAEADVSDGEASYIEEDYGLDDGQETWVNEIHELETKTSYVVALDWSYSNWWYDCYWWDYWYYDTHYSPYRSSFVFHLGAWYPGWYSSRSCWAPASWGYRYRWYDAYGYGWYARPHRPYYEWGHHSWAGYASGTEERHALSRTKRRSPEGSGGGKLYADAGLRARDGRQVWVAAEASTGSLTEERGKIRRPTTRTAVRDERPVRRELRGPDKRVRAPAGGRRPVKIKTLDHPTGPVHVDRTGDRGPRRPSRVDSPAEPPRKPPAKRPRTVQPPPARKKPPAVQDPPAKKKEPSTSVAPEGPPPKKGPRAPSRVSPRAAPEKKSPSTRGKKKAPARPRPGRR